MALGEKSNNTPPICWVCLLGPRWTRGQLLRRRCKVERRRLGRAATKSRGSFTWTDHNRSIRKEKNKEVNTGKGNLPSLTNCAVCGQPLVYATDPQEVSCSFCGGKDRSLIYCPAGHYVCDACHSRSAIDALKQILATTKERDPGAILEQPMAHPSVPVDGPEHHIMVPAAIVAAVKNAGYAADDALIAKTIDRASKVPGGWCGSYGDCGAAVGVGLAVSVITGATPLTGKPRTLAMGATAYSLSRMLDDQPRCCKRASRTAMSAAIHYLRDRLGIELPYARPAPCSYTKKNAECSREKCPYYGRQQ